jgi:hypothetical protein
MANIMIATPMYGGNCQGVFLKSIISLVEILKLNGHGVQFIDLYNESLITRARNTLTEEFLRKIHFTHLLFIDADQGFDPLGILKMIEEDVEIIGAPVPMKGINWERVREAALSGQKDLSSFTSIYNTRINDPKEIEKFKENSNQKIEVDHVGTGLVLIKREVFETLKEYVPSYRNGQGALYSIQQGESVYDFWRLEINEYANMLSEDYTFCKMWRDLGNKVYLAPYVKTTHVGTYIFR